jgi:hypothetical protein
MAESGDDANNKKTPWWEMPERRWRLYLQMFKPEGYYLMVSAPSPNCRSVGPQPFPFFCPGTELILEQIDGSQEKMDIDRIEVALMKFEPAFLTKVRERIRAGKLRQAWLLWIERDPRFEAITGPMWDTFSQILMPSRGPRKGNLTLFVEQYLRDHDTAGRPRPDLVTEIYFAAKRSLGLKPEDGVKDRRRIRDVLNKTGFALRTVFADLARRETRLEC